MATDGVLISSIARGGQKDLLTAFNALFNMPNPSIVILSAAKNLRQNGRSFASLRMTAVGFQQSKSLTKCGQAALPPRALILADF
jgi:hypothetical protein